MGYWGLSPRRGSTTGESKDMNIYMSGVKETVMDVHRWLSYGTPQGLVTSARVLRHKSQPVVPSVVVFVVTKIWTIGVVKEGVWWLRTCEQLKWERRGDLKRRDSIAMYW